MYIFENKTIIVENVEYVEYVVKRGENNKSII